MWTRPPISPASKLFNTESIRPATAQQGEYVPQLWSRIATLDPRDVTYVNETRSGGDDTKTSRSAPDFMNATNRFPVGDINEWDYITKDRKAHLRRAVQDDTENSYDAPDWFNQKLKAPQPERTAPVTSYRLGAMKRVVLKPLVEVDPYGLLPPKQLEPPNLRAGYYPTLAERQKGSLIKGELPPRFGMTETSNIGSGESNLNEKRYRYRERIGVTASSEIGQATPVFNQRIQQQASLQRSRNIDGFNETIHDIDTGFLRSTISGNAYRDEPPYQEHYRNAIKTQPDGSCIVRPSSSAGVPMSSTNSNNRPQTSGGIRGGRKVGHALFHALVLDHGNKPNQHLEMPLKILRQHDSLKATHGLTKNATEHFLKNELRQPPLNYYNASR
jgi:hypothetical protein